MMKLKLIICPLTVLFFSISILSGQEHHLINQNKEHSCLFDEVQKDYYQDHPESLNERLDFETKVKEAKKLKGSSLRTTPTYIIPVVFHVYGNYWPDDNQGNNREVTSERIEEALDSINQNFLGFNDPIDTSFSDIEGSMDIEFRLAQIDPNGNTTSGVIFHELKEGFGLNGTNDEEIAKYAWDNYKYFNIHIQLVIKSGSQNNSGVAWFPSTHQSDEGVARVVYNGKYILYSPPASSLTHEFGHFFGLEHCFTGGCVADPDEGDLVADTPPTSTGQGCGPGELNCFGDIINSQNHMDYNPCESMFTVGQVTRMESFMNHPARETLWQLSNQISTGIDQDLGPRVLFNYQDRFDSDLNKLLSLTENFENNGGILNHRRIKAIAGAKFAISGVLQEGVHYNSNDIPAGLDLVIEITSDSTGLITLGGQAIDHEKIHSGNFTVSFLDPAIVGGTSSIFSEAGVFSFEFSDTYENYYETFNPSISKAFSGHQTSSNYVTQFSPLSVGTDIKIHLSNYDGNSLVVTNSAQSLEVLCNVGSVNIKYLSEFAEIGENSSGTWLTNIPFQTSPARLSRDDYIDWHNKTGYLGFRVKTLTNSYLYGWLKASVSNDGTFGQIISMGINPDIGEPIITEVDRPHLVYSKDRFLESVANDGSIENDIIVDLKMDSFAVIGDLIAGTHYDINNVPAGLQFVATVLDSTRVKLSMNGTTVVDDWDYDRYINFEFLDNAFVSSNASDVLFKNYEFHMEYLGQDFTSPLSGITLEVIDGGLNYSGLAQFSMLTSHNGIDREKQSFQLQLYTTGIALGVKFISWRKEAVANDDYELTPLDQGTLIGPLSNWKNGRYYYSGTGQHMIDSDSYQLWRGKTKYIGIKVVRSGRVHYGWIKLNVTDDGTLFTYLEYGINGTPDDPIRAGCKSNLLIKDVVFDTDATFYSGDQIELDNVTVNSPYELTLIAPNLLISADVNELLEGSKLVLMGIDGCSLD